MKRPTKVIVLGQPFAIEWVAPRQPEACGHTDSHAQKIEVRPDMGEALTRSTLLHEIIHAVSYMQLDDGLTEQQVLSLEASLFQVFTSNPKVRDWMFGGGTD